MTCKYISPRVPVSSCFTNQDTRDRHSSDAGITQHDMGATLLGHARMYILNHRQKIHYIAQLRVFEDWRILACKKFHATHRLPPISRRYTSSHVHCFETALNLSAHGDLERYAWWDGSRNFIACFGYTTELVSTPCNDIPRCKYSMLVPTL
jgi:hypothetical protein